MQTCDAQHLTGRLIEGDEVHGLLAIDLGEPGNECKGWRAAALPATSAPPKRARPHSAIGWSGVFCNS